MWHVAAGVSSANTHLVFLCNTLNTQNCWNPHCFHCRVAFSRGPSCNICSLSCIHKNCIPRMLLCWQYVSWHNGFQESSRFSILHHICYILTFHCIGKNCWKWKQSVWQFRQKWKCFGSVSGKTVLPKQITRIFLAGLIGFVWKFWSIILQNLHSFLVLGKWPEKWWNIRGGIRDALLHQIRSFFEH